MFPFFSSVCVCVSMHGGNGLFFCKQTVFLCSRTLHGTDVKSRSCWMKVRQSEFVNVFLLTSVRFELMWFFFVHCWSLIRPLLTTYTKWPLRRCWKLSVRPSQVSVYFFTFPLFCLSPLFTWLIHLILFYESCSSLHVISRMRSDFARREGVDTFQKRLLHLWNLNI